MRAWLALVGGGVLLAAWAMAAAAPAKSPTARDTALTTVFLVRHAERSELYVGADPPLDAAGRRRALDLERTLHDAGIRRVYSTHFSRTRQTAKPLAAALGESLLVVDEIDEQVAEIRRHPGVTALVVGHSDNLPKIYAGLTGQPDSTLGPVRYDMLFVLTLGPGGASHLARLRYGAPVEPSASAASTPGKP